MTPHSDFPVSTPIITDVLAQAIHVETLEQEKKPRAFPTTFRNSDAGKCGRYMGFEATSTPPSNPPDLSSAWVMWLGTQLHYELQIALQRRYPDCQVEPTVRHGDLTSGHLDAVVKTLEHGTICYELKTMGAFGFDKSIGLNRKGWKMEMPEGPRWTTKLQGALNATAIDADLLVIGEISLESVSKSLAEKVGLSELGRTIAEFHYTKAEFGPWAEEELARMGQIAAELSDGTLPAPVAVGDEGQPVKLNPNASRPDWRCTYCNHFDTCKRTTN